MRMIATFHMLVCVSVESLLLAYKTDRDLNTSAVSFISKGTPFVLSPFVAQHDQFKVTDLWSRNCPQERGLQAT